MRCKGKTKKGSRCWKTVVIGNSGYYCAQHEDQTPVIETFDCARCGSGKQTTYRVQVDALSDESTPLCNSCATALQRINLEFLRIGDVDHKLLVFRGGL